ncbi:hypothetical protein [Neptuniibacter sp. QD37_11]|uniref:hypothetical protein n=1 Tax=Neptuniibacter sp. QD37_11 TaxID=3398209 RepID=UPI0039F45F20
MNTGKVAIIISIWLCWPIIAVVASFIIFGFEGQCAVDNCDPNHEWWHDVLFVMYLVLPPILMSVFVILRKGKG